MCCVYDQEKTVHPINISWYMIPPIEIYRLIDSNWFKRMNMQLGWNECARYEYFDGVSMSLLPFQF